MQKILSVGRFALQTIFFMFFAAPMHAATTLEKIAQSGSISIGFDTTFPFAYLDGNNKPIGYTIDICHKVVDAIKQKLGRSDIAIKYKVLKTAERIPSLVSGDIDLECGSMTNTATRRKEIAFSITMFVAETRLLTHKGSPTKSVTDLTDSKVIVTKSSTSESIVNDLNKRLMLNISPVFGETNPASFTLFEQNKADAFILDDILLHSQLATAKDPENMVVTKTPLSLEALAVGLRKDDPGFKKLVDTEISRIILQKEIFDIYNRWFLSPVPPKQVNLNYTMTPLVKDAFRIPSDWSPN